MKEHRRSPRDLARAFMRHLRAVSAHNHRLALTPMRGKRPILKGWNKRPRPTKDEVIEWAKKGNVGVRTGKSSGIIGLDVDDGGNIEALCGMKPETPTVITGGGGRHVLFEAPDFDVRCSTKKIAFNIDVRGEGGVLVLAGSTHPETDELYEWEEGLSIEDVPLAPLPPSVLEWLRNDAMASAPVNLECVSIAKAIDSVLTVAPGERNDALNREAFKLGAAIDAGLLQRDEVEEALLETALTTGLSEAEIRLTMRSGIDSGMSRSGNAPRPVFRRSDAGNADRLVHHHGKDLLFDHSSRSWMNWDGVRWRRDDTGEVLRKARQEIAKLYSESRNERDLEKQKKALSFAMRSESSPRLRAMVELAQVDEKVAVTSDQFDSDLWLLNLENGTYNLRTGELQEHQRSDRITRVIPIEYQKNAKAPLWRKFLFKVFGGNHSLIQYVARCVGYSLTGSTKEQVLFLMFGTGANGKSTFLEVLRAVCGEYARQAEFETFLSRRHKSIPNDVARLAGARLVSANEADAGRRIDEALVKSLTGGDRVTARFLYREFFEFDPQFKIWLATNHKPEIRGTDEAIWRRVQMVPFAVQIPSDERDQTLLDKLLEEAPGILRWAINGCHEWQEEGLDPPPAVRAVTRQYREECDVLGEFLGECCEVNPRARVRASELYYAYEMWRNHQGAAEMSRQLFAMRLKERDEAFTSEKRGGRRWWTGLQVVQGR